MEKETQVLWLALFGDHSGKTHLAGNCIRVNTIYPERLQFAKCGAR